MGESDMLDFNAALAELQLGKDELQNLIQKGELRAFRAGGTMKFRKADIDSMKKERATEPTIIIPAATGQIAGANMDVPQDLGVDESAATVVPETTPGGAAPTVELGGGSRSGTEEIVFEDSDLEILPLDADASAATAEVTVAAEEPVTIAADEPAVGLDQPVAAPAPARREAAAAAPMISRRTQAAYAKEPGDWIWTSCLAVAGAIFVLAGSTFAVMLWKGYYSESKRDKFIPAFLEFFGADGYFKEVGDPKAE